MYTDLINNINDNCKFSLITDSNVSIRFPHYNIVSITSDDVYKENYKNIPKDIVDFLINEFRSKSDDFKDLWSFMSIQKYNIGDYISPHVDAYNWHKLLILTDSDIDGLTVEDYKEKKLIFYPDKQGTCFSIPSLCMHWVNPVREKVRYSAVLMK